MTDDERRELKRKKDRQRYAANREAQLEKNRKWRAANPGKHLAAVRIWKAANPERVLEHKRNAPSAKSEKTRERVRSWHKAHAEKVRANHDRWRYSHPEKLRAIAAINRATKKNRTPAWANLKAITEFYARCPPGHHVDHFFPLQGRVVSGLHVEENLRYLPAAENRKKSATIPTQEEISRFIGLQSACQ